MKILNRDEVGFNSLEFVGKKVYIQRWLTVNEVHVSHFILIQDRTAKLTGSAIRGMATTMATAIVAGAVGVLTTAISNRVKVDMDLDIYLTNGMMIETRTTQVADLEALLKHTPVPNPREQYRRKRGII